MRDNIQHRFSWRKDYIHVKKTCKLACFKVWFASCFQLVWRDSTLHTFTCSTLSTWNLSKGLSLCTVWNLFIVVLSALTNSSSSSTEIKCLQTSSKIDCLTNFVLLIGKEMNILGHLKQHWVVSCVSYASQL